MKVWSGGGIECEIFGETREIAAVGFESVDGDAESERDGVKADIRADIKGAGAGANEATEEEDVGVVILAGSGGVALFQRAEIEFRAVAEAHVYDAFGFGAGFDGEGAGFGREIAVAAKKREMVRGGESGASEEVRTGHTG